MRFVPSLGSIVFLCVACLPERTHAQTIAAQYERRELSVPVRDGTKLFAVALTPKSTTSPLPILLIRTPYSAAGLLPSVNLPPQYKELADDGYIFVAEDIRGRIQEELFEMLAARRSVWLG